MPMFAAPGQMVRSASTNSKMRTTAASPTLVGAQFGVVLLPVLQMPRVTLTVRAQPAFMSGTRTTDLVHYPSPIEGWPVATPTSTPCHPVGPP